MPVNIPFGATPGTAPVIQPQPMPQVQPTLQQPAAPTFYPFPGAQNFNIQQPLQQTVPTVQTPQRPAGLPGKMVTSSAEITPNDVPMDGRVSLFYLQDYSAIIAKAWNAEGKIDTVIYVPQQPEKPKDETAEGQNGGESPQLQEILNKLQNLTDVISNMPKTPGEDSLKSLSETINSRLDTVDLMLGELATSQQKTTKQAKSSIVVPE